VRNQLLFMFVSALLALSPPLRAQSNRGAISGTVYDSSGAVIAGATVRITNAGTNQAFITKTAGNGTYAQSELEPVFYTVAVEQAGFRQKVVTQVKVDTTGNTRVDATLEAGDVSTKVEVAADAAILNTQNSTLSSTVGQRQIEDLPVAERSVFSLMQTLPNVSGDYFIETGYVTQTPESPVAGFSVNGGRMGSTSIIADGANNAAVGVGRAVSTFSPDVVQEFNVQTSGFSAEYGQTGGGVVSVTTKSGSNEFHETLYGYTRNPALNAAPYAIGTAARPASARRQTQAGFLWSGPVLIPKVYNGRNKSFFFFAFEPQWVSDGTPINDLLPNAQFLQGNFSNAVAVNGGVTTAALAKQYGATVTGDATIYDQFNVIGTQLTRIAAPASGQTYAPFPNNTIPQSMLDPVALKILKYQPKASDYFLLNGQLNNWLSERTVVNREQRYTMRFDHNLTDSHRLTFRYTRIPIAAYRYAGNGSTNVDQVNSLTSDSQRSNQFMLAYTWIASPTLINELRLSFYRADYSSVNPPNWQTQNLSTALGLPSVTSAGLPYFNVGGAAGWGNVGQRSISSIGTRIDESYDITDTLTRTKGTHTLKAGTNLRRQLENLATQGYAQGGSYSFGADLTNSAQSGGSGGITLASFLLGVPDSVTLSPAVIPYYYRWSSAAGFLQDDWRMKPNLTLNLGVRYSLQLPRSEKYNHQGSFLLQDSQSVALPSPITLPTGQVLTSALVPPFAFSGYGGRSPYLFPIDWMGLEPRFGFAWTPHYGWNNAGKLVVRGGYGISHSPLTGLQTAATPNFATPTNSFTWNSGQQNPSYVTRLSSNPPALTALSPAQVLNIPSNGLVYNNSLAIPGFVIAGGTKDPYVQNWNFTIGFQPGHSFVVEAAYVGSKGTHLFTPGQALNLCPYADITGYLNQNLSPWTTITDPLGRKNINGGTLSIPRCGQAEPYLGFDQLLSYLQTSADSIRHAGYVTVSRRMNHGLYFTASYTFGKSIDDASDAGEQLQATSSQSPGQARYGGTYANDRSVSTFDVRHLINGTVIWDLPVGSGRQWISRPSRFLSPVITGWTLSANARAQSGFPFQPLITDGNYITGASDWSVRPNLVPGVPLVNPLYHSNCQISPCEPYVNPAAFMRPPEGQLGNAPRTIESLSGPLKKYLNVSLQKNFYPFGKDNSKRIQFRVDAINILNHPNFGFNNYGNGRLMTAPSQGAITAAAYNTWAAANNQPLSTTAAGAANLALVQSFVTGSYLPGTSILPADYFSVPLPVGFATAAPTSYNILTPVGYKYYTLRNSYSTTFGNFTANNGATEYQRYIQFGLKIFF